jgi:hypothetical protein
MKWALAASQLALLSVLVWRGAWRMVPAFAVYLAFAAVSSITYDPWNGRAFAWMSIPSTALRVLVLLECVSVLTARQIDPARALLTLDGLIGALIIISAGWGIHSDYGAIITASTYCSMGLAAGVWVVIGALWKKGALATDWRRAYAVGLGVYFGVMALARIGAPWNVAQNVSLSAYVLTFCWLAKQFFDTGSDPRTPEIENKHD